MNKVVELYFIKGGRTFEKQNLRRECKTSEKRKIF